MMEGAFFVSRTELLSWANDFLQIGLTKVEQCANAAVYCQIIDACHPGTVMMRKLNWMARNDHEHIPNYKVLQAGFDKCGITKNIPVDMLIRGKYQDNLEMLQWFKHYWENMYTGDLKDYDPVAPRRGMQLPDWAKCTLPGETQKENVRPARPRPKTVAEGYAGNAPSEAPSSTVTKASGGAAPKPRAQPKAVPSKDVQRGYAAPARPDSAQSVADRAELEGLRAEAAELKTTVDGLEGERDYYFRKLRDIEILCQNLEAPETHKDMDVTKLVSNVQAILYARDDGENAEQ
jgi:RP/EB family microtubule-associated protein